MEDVDEFLSIEEIRARFDGEWVLIDDPQTDEYHEVHGGIVRCHSKDRDEIHRRTMELPVPRRCAVLHFGEMRPGTALMV